MVGSVPYKQGDSLLQRSLRYDSVSRNPVDAKIDAHSAGSCTVQANNKPFFLAAMIVNNGVCVCSFVLSCVCTNKLLVTIF